jgi:hypothetical protein
MEVRVEKLKNPPDVFSDMSCQQQINVTPEDMSIRMNIFILEKSEEDTEGLHYLILYK